MHLYERAPYYFVIHILLGFVAAWIPLVGGLAVAYQLTQYILDIRFFPVELRVAQGNNILHTGVKLGEMVAGYIAGRYVKKNINNR
jgi:hypothetical protein